MVVCTFNLSTLEAAGSLLKFEARLFYIVRHSKDKKQNKIPQNFQFLGNEDCSQIYSIDLNSPKQSF